MIREGIKFTNVHVPNKCSYCKLFHRNKKPRYYYRQEPCISKLYKICMNPKSKNFIPLQYYDSLKNINTNAKEKKRNRS